MTAGDTSHKAAPERFYAPWYAQPDDLIGGWCVMLSPAPPSAGGIVIAEFCREDAARHIAELHNEWLACTAAASAGGEDPR